MVLGVCAAVAIASLVGHISAATPFAISTTPIVPVNQVAEGQPGGDVAAAQITRILTESGLRFESLDEATWRVTVSGPTRNVTIVVAASDGVIFLAVPLVDHSLLNNDNAIFEQLLKINGQLTRAKVALADNGDLFVGISDSFDSMNRAEFLSLTAELTSAVDFVAVRFGPAPSDSANPRISDKTTVGTTETATQIPTVLTNDAIVKLVKAGMAERDVVARITASEGRFDLSKDALVRLRTDDVSDPIMVAMFGKTMADQQQGEVRAFHRLGEQGGKPLLSEGRFVVFDRNIRFRDLQQGNSLNVSCGDVAAFQLHRPIRRETFLEIFLKPTLQQPGGSVWHFTDSSLSADWALKMSQRLTLLCGTPASFGGSVTTTSLRPPVPSSEPSTGVNGSTAFTVPPSNIALTTNSGSVGALEAKLEGLKARYRKLRDENEKDRRNLPIARANCKETGSLLGNIGSAANCLAADQMEKDISKRDVELQLIDIDLRDTANSLDAARRR